MFTSSSASTNDSPLSNIYDVIMVKQSIPIKNISTTMKNNKSVYECKLFTEKKKKEDFYPPNSLDFANHCIKSVHHNNKKNTNYSLKRKRISKDYVMLQNSFENVTASFTLIEGHQAFQLREPSLNEKQTVNDEKRFKKLKTNDNEPQTQLLQTFQFNEKKKNPLKIAIIDLLQYKLTQLGFTLVLYPHQDEAVSWMVDKELQLTKQLNTTHNYNINHTQTINLNTGGILADAMGMGKTTTCIATIIYSDNILKDRYCENLTTLDTTLIICPKSLLIQWKSEILRSSTQFKDHNIDIYNGRDLYQKEIPQSDLLDKKFMITTYETVRNIYKYLFLEKKQATIFNKQNDHQPMYSFYQLLFTMQWKRIILDEAHKIRNINSQLTTAILQLKSYFKWCVTGTPLNNSVKDIHSLCAFIGVKPYRELSWWTTLNNEKLLEWRERYLLSRSKTVLNLPPVRTITLYFEMCGRQKQIYDKIVTMSLNSINDYKKNNWATQNNRNSKFNGINLYNVYIVWLLRLRQATNDALLSLEKKNIKYIIQKEYIQTVETNKEQDKNSVIDPGDTTTSIPPTTTTTTTTTQNCIGCDKVVIISYQDNMVVDGLNENQLGNNATDINQYDVDELNCGILLSCGHCWCKTCLKGTNQVCTLCYVDNYNKSSSRLLFSNKNIFANHLSFENDLNNYELDHITIRDSVITDDNTIEEYFESSQLLKSLFDYGENNFHDAIDRIVKVNFCIDKTNLLVHTVKYLISCSKENKILIFTQWTSYMDIIAYYLKKHNITFVHFDGSININERNRLVEDFNNNKNTKVFLSSLQAGGVGLNLTSANYVFLTERWYNPFVEYQASDRCYRLGQNRSVTIIRLHAQNTIEDEIKNIQMSKMNDFNIVVDGMGSFISHGKNTLDMKQLNRIFNQ